MKKDGKLTTGIALIILAVIFLICFWNDVIGLFRKTVDLDHELENDIAVGSRVTVGVDAVVDHYATMEHKRYGVTTSEDYYYMLWLDDDSFIGIEVNKSDKATLDDICDATWDYVNYDADALPSKTYFSGTLTKMSSKEKEYFQELLEDMGYESDEWDDVARYYTIDTTSTVGSAIAILVIIGVLLIVGVICILLDVKGRKKAKAAQGSAGAGFDSASFDSAYAGGFNGYGQGNAGGNPYGSGSYGAGNPNGGAPYGGGSYGTGYGTGGTNGGDPFGSYRAGGTTGSPNGGNAYGSGGYGTDGTNGSTAYGGTDGNNGQGNNGYGQ